MSMRLCHGRPHNANTMSSNHRNECLGIHMRIVHSLTCGLDTREMSPISVSSGRLATRGRYVVRTELGRCSFGRAEELDDNDMPGGPSTRGTKNAHPARTHRALKIWCYVAKGTRGGPFHPCDHIQRFYCVLHAL